MSSNSLVEYTTLRVDTVERVVALSDPKMLEAPFCYLAGHMLVQFNLQEKKFRALFARRWFLVCRRLQSRYRRYLCQIV